MTVLTHGRDLLGLTLRAEPTFRCWNCPLRAKQGCAGCNSAGPTLIPSGIVTLTLTSRNLVPRCSRGTSFQGPPLHTQDALHRNRAQLRGHGHRRRRQPAVWSGEFRLTTMISMTHLHVHTESLMLLTGQHNPQRDLASHLCCQGGASAVDPTKMAIGMALIVLSQAVQAAQCTAEVRRAALPRLCGSSHSLTIQFWRQCSTPSCKPALRCQQLLSGNSARACFPCRP